MSHNMQAALPQPSTRSFIVVFSKLGVFDVCLVWVRFSDSLVRFVELYYRPHWHQHSIDQRIMLLKKNTEKLFYNKFRRDVKHDVNKLG